MVSCCFICASSSRVRPFAWPFIDIYNKFKLTVLKRLELPQSPAPSPYSRPVHYYAEKRTRDQMESDALNRQSCHRNHIAAGLTRASCTLAHNSGPPSSWPVSSPPGPNHSPGQCAHWPVDPRVNHDYPMGPVSSIAGTLALVDLATGSYSCAPHTCNGPDSTSLDSLGIWRAKSQACYNR